MVRKVDIQSIENKARKTREVLGVVLDEKIDPIDLIRRIEYIKFVKEIAIVSDESLSNKEGRNIEKDNRLELSESLYIKLESGDGRSLFTLAHELGHVVCKHKHTRNRVAVGRAREYGTQLKFDEREADAFAIAFLVPEELAQVTQETTPAEISKRFGVSISAARYRLKELQRRHRLRNGIRRAIPFGTKKINEFDSGNYDEAMLEMAKNSKSWNNRS